MKKKKTWLWGLLAAVILIEAILLFTKPWKTRHKDPITERLEQIEAALGDEWTKTAETRIVPFTLYNADGDTLVYYVIATTRGDGTPAPDGFDPALKEIIDPNTADSSRACKVGALDAVIYEAGYRAYLCWTISEQYTSVIEYSPDSVSESNVIRMAESVSANNNANKDC